MNTPINGNHWLHNNNSADPDWEEEDWTGEDGDRYDEDPDDDPTGLADFDTTDDPLADAIAADLAALAIDAPPILLDRIAATWIRVPSVIGDLYVASTDLGIAYLRTSDAVHDDAREFAEEFHERFTRR